MQVDLRRSQRNRRPPIRPDEVFSFATLVGPRVSTSSQASSETEMPTGYDGGF
jgi:hypothetical protein